MQKRTGAERYLDARLRDSAYREAHDDARRRIESIDRMVRALDRRREDLGLSKAELARRAEIPPEGVRRLFSAQRPNPTMQTLTALAEALGLELVVVEQGAREAKAPMLGGQSATRAPSGASGTRRRTA